jgi:CDP-diacylglycerol--serine O-phosphatidyltransferase
LQGPAADICWEKALACIFFAAVFDMLDGRAARLLKAQSPFGAMLDSLSDFLCFGVAPGLLLHQWTLNDVEVANRSADAIGLAAVMTYILCAALRLARFTAAARVVKLAPGMPPPPEPKPNPHAFKFFVGMPSPAAAGAVLIPPMLAVSTFPHEQAPDWVVILFTFLISGLMIGRQPMFSFKRVRIPRRWVVPFLVVIGLIVAGAVKFPFFTAALVCGAYLLTTPLSMMVHRRLLATNRTEMVPPPAPAL